MSKNVSRNITSLRGIAAICIIIYHYVSIFAKQFDMGTKYKYFDFSYLTFGVPMFFVLSAMFLYKKSYDLKSPLKLLLYRLIRLYPAYWMAVTLTFFIRFFLMRDEVTVLDYVANLTMVEDLFGIQQLDGVYWTMIYELMLLFIMVLITFVQSFRTKTISTNVICGIWIGLGFASQFVMKISGQSSSSIKLLLFGSSYISVFVMGLILCDVYIFRGGGARCDKWNKINIILALAYEVIFMPVAATGIAVFAVVLVWGAMSGRFENVRIFEIISCKTVYFGTISYPLYLCHRYVGEFFSSFVSVNQTYIWALFLMIISFGVSACFAIGISKLEKKIINKLKSLKAYKRLFPL